MLYIHRLPTSVFCIIWAVFIAAELAVKCTIARAQMFDIQLHLKLSCCMALWQFSDSCCNALTGISATLSLRGVKELHEVSDPYVTPDSVLQGWMVALWSMPMYYLLNVTFSRRCPKCWEGNGSNVIVSVGLSKSCRMVNPEKNIAKQHSEGPGSLLSDIFLLPRLFVRTWFISHISPTVVLGFCSSNGMNANTSPNFWLH